MRSLPLAEGFLFYCCMIIGIAAYPVRSCTRSTPKQSSLLQLANKRNEEDGNYCNNDDLQPINNDTNNMQHQRHRPKLFVMDLDDTLWTPPVPERASIEFSSWQQNIQLFPDVPILFQQMLEYKEEENNNQNDNILQWAIASRAPNKDGVLQLLQTIEISAVGTTLADIFQHNIEIYDTNKKRHFEALKSKTNIAFQDMVFFDDWDMNCFEVSQLGVLCCHCPNGITIDLFHKSLDHYHMLKTQDINNWMGYIITEEGPPFY